MASSAIPEIKNVDIDPNGTFKYILIKVGCNGAGEKLIVRGYAECGYHGSAPSEALFIGDFLQLTTPISSS
ncbi:unnamed protein product [Ceutorhynchus assimilis]|uniref:Uncharacterized protein n=1 Tax=Ceutorhynchus assimilis TaxID=467358 RepID=A0A9N9MQ24_9CUCU|nr:unnamed protein product [Ceutorhynchus assimilis]